MHEFTEDFRNLARSVEVHNQTKGQSYREVGGGGGGGWVGSNKPTNFSLAKLLLALVVKEV